MFLCIDQDLPPLPQKKVYSSGGRLESKMYTFNNLRVRSIVPTFTCTCTGEIFSSRVT